jgi:hypothetical protein
MRAIENWEGNNIIVLTNLNFKYYHTCF